MTFLNPPSFQTGDVLSASKVNHLLTDIDTLYGWYYGPNYGVDQQQFSLSQPSETVEGWVGWCILTGDTLVIQITNVEGTGVKAKVYFDGVQIGTLAGYGAGTHNIPLPIGANSWTAWTAYRIKVVTVRPELSGGLIVARVFLKDSSIPAAGTLTGFSDGDTSDAADFNAIGDGIRNVEPVVVQPIIGCRGSEWYEVQATNTGWTTVQSWSMQHKVNALRCSLFIQGARSDAQGGELGDISARLTHNGTQVNGALWDVAPYGTLRITDEIFTLPGSPVVGTFYTVALQIKQENAWLRDWYVAPYYVYEDQLGLPGGYGETLRWEHGNYARGDSGNPNLSVLSDNLGGINVNATACGATNLVQREPISTLEFPRFANYNRRFYHVRRWRWLAYKQHEWLPQFGDTDTPAATINWTYDGITWDSYTLPEIEGGGFYDLDSSPVVQGMTFYASGVQYAIQSPYVYQ